ncbi:hypothetical protein FB565_005990 [Actinoplanes lutulentus]|uniref:Uncharacterized protein n=1 Tax=Actinoplanes lutulentus TaxID=1287878 RepID=A0A327Z8H0_9ACTN|nr:hypothetical protein [Actinoplanes lutulentus]MBB2946232.1 hypothetical protein [Actinoplanes lutulentus]RAK32920.1 hypothetical protein B0I29_113217 [Actinoplanes lutulentus]
MSSAMDGSAMDGSTVGGGTVDGSAMDGSTVGGGAVDGTAEARYRRWLALYPRDFREEYEDEMLGVLMSDGRPGPRQFLDLFRAAVAVRLRRVPAPHAFRQAARVVQLFGALLLLANVLRLVLPFLVRPDHLVALDAIEVLRVAAWSLVLIAALRSWRLLGFAGSAAGLAGEIAAPARWYLDTPAMVLNAYWLIMAAAVVLIAGLIATRGRGGVRGLGLVLAASAVLASTNEVAWSAPMYVSRAVLVGEGAPMWFLTTDAVLVGGALLLVAAVVLVVLAVIRQEAPVRRWLLAWAAPVLVTVPLIRTGFGAFIDHNKGHPEATRLIDPLQWTVLVLVPLAAFLVVASLTSRYERGRA